MSEDRYKELPQVKNLSEFSLKQFNILIDELNILKDAHDKQMAVVHRIQKDMNRVNKELQSFWSHMKETK